MMEVERIGPNSPLSPPDLVERELEEEARIREEERIREEQAREERLRQEEIADDRSVDEFA